MQAEEGKGRLTLPLARGEGSWARAWRKMIRKKVGLACLAIIVVMYMAGALASWVTPYGYNDQNLVPPSVEQRVSEAPFGSLEFWFREDFSGPESVENGLPLIGGATVAFSEMKSVEVIKASPSEVTVEIQLLNGDSVDGQLKWPSGRVEHGSSGSTRLKDVKRIDFQPPTSESVGTATVTSEFSPRFCSLCRGPSLRHPFGTDLVGRDQFTRVIYSLRTTVIVTLAGIVTGSLILGIGLGLLSGYFGRWVDSVIMRAGEIFLAFPTIFLVILIAAAVRPKVVDWVYGFGQTGVDIVRLGVIDYVIVFGALAVFSWVGVARIVRGQVIAIKENQYVEASIAVGASKWRILRVHIFPNILSPIIVLVSMGMGTIAGSEVFLSFIGIGIQSPTPSLGIMMFEFGSVAVLRSQPHLLLFPAGTLAVLLFTFNLLGDALNDALNPRTR